MLRFFSVFYFNFYFYFILLYKSFFIIGDWNAKEGSQETPGVTGKFGLGIWNEAGKGE